MKFIHIADVHLGAAPDADRAWGQNRSAEIEGTFDRVLEICEEQQIDLLLIAGDLFHEPPTEEQLQQLDEKLSALSVTRTVMIAGARDYIAEDAPAAKYRFQSKTVLLPRDKTTNAYLKDINTCVTGFSYGKPEYRERTLEHINPGRSGAINILLGHGGDATHMPFSKEALARKGFHYVAMGHLHKPAHVLKNRMAFAGSLEPLGCGETGRHGYIYGEIQDGVTRISMQPISRRSYRKLEIQLTEELDENEILEAVELQIRKLGYDDIYMITLTGRMAEQVKPDFSKLKERYNIYSITDRTLSDRDALRLLQGNSNNLLGQFIQEMHQNKDVDEATRNKALRYGVEALRMTGDE